MIHTPLNQAVNAFLAQILPLTEEDLERPWSWGAYDSEGIRFACFRTFEELQTLGTRLLQERDTQGASPSSAQRILAQYHLTYQDLLAVLMGLDEETAEISPGGQEWPVRRTLAHIIGADLGFYAVVKYALDRHRSQDNRPAEIPDEAWDDLLGETEEVTQARLDDPLPGLIEYHTLYHARILREFAGIQDDELEIPAMYWEGYPLNLRFRLHRFDSHMRQHTIQIEKTLRQIGQTPTEPARLARMILNSLAFVNGARIGQWDLGAAAIEQVAMQIDNQVAEIQEILAR